MLLQLQFLTLEFDSKVSQSQLLPNLRQKLALSPFV